MSEKLKEALSAVVDDEADEFELRRVLDEVGKNPELKATWNRYHLVSALLRAERTSSGEELRERVWAALELAEGDAPAADAEPAPLEVDPAPAGRRRVNQLTGLAVAAAVALAVLLVGVTLEDPETSRTPELADVAPAGAPSAVVPSAGISAAEQARLQALILAHTQQVGMNQPGPAAFTKLVTYQRP